MVAGTGLRLWHYLSGRDLFIDEARLALNIGTRGPAELFQPLALEQVAPVPFLLLVKASVELLGMHEMSLRLVPFLAGCLLLPLMWRLASRFLNPFFALLALALVALSPAMIAASTSAKPYSVDAFTATVLLLLGLWLIEDAGSQRRLALAIAVWVLAAFFSFTAVMVTAPAIMIAAIAALRQRQYSQLRALALGVLLAAAATVIPYVGLYSVVGESPYMSEFWNGAFITGRASHDILVAVAFVWGWIAGIMDGSPTDTVAQAILRAGAVVVVLLVVLGAWAIAKARGPLRAMLLVGPVVAFIGLNAMRAYPAVLRLELFAVPAAAILFAGALQLPAIGVGGRAMKWAAASIAGCTIGLMLTSSVVPRFWPYYSQELESVIRVIPDSATLVYVNAGAVPGWAYYSTDWRDPDLGRLRWLIRSMSYGGGAFENSSTLAAEVSVAELRRSAQGRIELLGARTGVRIVPYRAVDTMPMPGWAEKEAGRVLIEPSDEAWLVFANHRSVENAFLGALEAKGAQVRSAVAAAGAAVLHLELPPRRTPEPHE